jgi:hypothetical protein
MAGGKVKGMLRVLYLHGFEETASSPKPMALLNDSRFEVFVPPLDIYFTKSKSPLRYMCEEKYTTKIRQANTCLKLKTKIS